MTPDSFWYRALDLVADAFDVALTLLAIAAPRLRGTWRGWLPAVRYVVAGLVGLGFIYGVAALDAHFGLWPAVGLDYSTHTAYAVSLATTIICWDRLWRTPLVVALCGNALLILVLGYHGPLDIVTAAMVAAPGAWVAMRILGPSHPCQNSGRVGPKI